MFCCCVRYFRVFLPFSCCVLLLPFFSSVGSVFLRPECREYAVGHTSVSLDLGSVRKRRIYPRRTRGRGKRANSRSSPSFQCGKHTQHVARARLCCRPPIQHHSHSTLSLSTKKYIRGQHIPGVAGVPEPCLGHARFFRTCHTSFARQLSSCSDP